MNTEERNCILERCAEISRQLNVLRTKSFCPANSKLQADLKREYSELSDRIINEVFTLGELSIKRQISYVFQNGETVPPNGNSFYFGAEKKTYKVTYTNGIPSSIEGYELSDVTHQPAKVRFTLKLVESFEKSRLVPHRKTDTKIPELRPIDFRENSRRVLSGLQPLDPNQVQEAEAAATEKPKDKLTKKLSAFFNRGEDQ